MKTIKRLWYAWSPQPTWRECAQLTVIETGICLVFVGLCGAL